MNAKSRINLSLRIRSFFIDEIRKACGKDYPLIEDRIPEFLNLDSLRETLFKAKEAVEEVKRRGAMHSETHKVIVKRIK
jgi:hypothetical protein